MVIFNFTTDSLTDLLNVAGLTFACFVLNPFLNFLHCYVEDRTQLTLQLAGEVSVNCSGQKSWRERGREERGKEGWGVWSCRQCHRLGFIYLIVFLYLSFYLEIESPASQAGPKL